MSYEYNRESEYGGGRGNRGGHHQGNLQGDNDEEGYRNRNDDYSSNQSRRDDGNVATAGYGREAERPTREYNAGREDGETGGGYGAGARPNLQSQSFEDRRNEYDQTENRSRNQDSEGYGGRGGRSAVGSGETYVGRNRGDDERRTTDTYGGESASAYSSGNQGGYGSMGQASNTTKSTGTYVAGSGEKWKPGQEMHFPAAEAKDEENPYVPVAQQMAGDTHGALKDGVKQLGDWAETKANELLGSVKPK